MLVCDQITHPSMYFTEPSPYLEDTYYGDSYLEHWVNEYWDFHENRWVLADVDGYYEYESRFGYSQFDLPRKKFVTASEAWLCLRKNTLTKKIDVFSPDPLQGVCEYLFMDFHALLNNEIFYSY